MSYCEIVNKVLLLVIYLIIMTLLIYYNIVEFEKCISSSMFLIPIMFSQKQTCNISLLVLALSSGLYHSRRTTSTEILDKAAIAYTTSTYLFNNDVWFQTLMYLISCSIQMLNNNSLLCKVLYALAAIKTLSENHYAGIPLMYGIYQFIENNDLITKTKQYNWHLAQSFYLLMGTISMYETDPDIHVVIAYVFMYIISELEFSQITNPC